MGYRRKRWAIGLTAVAVILMAATLIACGTDDPYTGSWTGDKGEGTFTVTIQKANEGWWKIDVAPEGIQTYGAEINGELQTMNGGSSFKRSGDHLEFTIASEKTDPAVLVRQ
jgi:hypothetical protein